MTPLPWTEEGRHVRRRGEDGPRPAELEVVAQWAMQHTAPRVQALTVRAHEGRAKRQRVVLACCPGDPRTKGGQGCKDYYGLFPPSPSGPPRAPRDVESGPRERLCGRVAESARCEADGDAACL